MWYGGDVNGLDEQNGWANIVMMLMLIASYWLESSVKGKYEKIGAFALGALMFISFLFYSANFSLY